MDVTDFIQPAGELSEALFPGVDLEEAVAAWIADALTRTTNPNAQRSWVLHRAYSAVADRMHAGLASESKRGASAARAAEQFRYWSRKAATQLAAYQAVSTARSAVTEVRPVW